MTSDSSGPNDDVPRAVADVAALTLDVPMRVKELPAVDDRIDYEQYERPQLRDSIESLLSIGSALKVFFLSFFATFPIVWGVIVWLFLGHGWLAFVGAVAGGLLVAGSLALLFAGVMVAHKILGETVSVVDETYGTVATIVKDVGTSQKDGVVATSAAVFRGVNQHLVLPIVESVIRARLGWFGIPILWIYRGVFLRTINASTQAMLTGASKISVPGSTYVELAAGAVQSGVSSTAVSVDWWLDALQPYVTGSTRAIRSAVLAPLWVVFALATLFASGVIGFLWWGL